MLTFTVHEPPNPPADRVDRAESLVFIKDGFSWIAALFTPLLAHRQPAVVAAAWLCGAERRLRGRQALRGRATSAGSAWRCWLCNLHGRLRGRHAASRWALERRGWRMLGSVTGKTAAECERRFFETWLPAQPIIAPRADPPADRGWRRLGGLIGTRT